jgi:hypothetical protein
MAPQNTNDEQKFDLESHIFENSEQKRGLIVVVVLCFLATVGMFCLIITLVILKNKRDKRKRAAKMDAEKYVLKGKDKQRRYQRLEDEEGDVWSTEMEGMGRNRAARGEYADASRTRREDGERS